MSKIVRTKEAAHAELNRELPHLKGDWHHLRRILNHMDAHRPEWKKRTLAFKLYYAVMADVPLTRQEIAENLGFRVAWVGSIIHHTLRRLKHPSWKDPAKWPEIPISPTTLSQLKPGHIADIAILLEAWRYQKTGTRLYMSELKLAAEELNIADAEMEQFYLAICDHLMQRR